LHSEEVIEKIDNGPVYVREIGRLSNHFLNLEEEEEGHMLQRTQHNP
jgi:hypothetical protein